MKEAKGGDPFDYQEFNKQGIRVIKNEEEYTKKVVETHKEITKVKLSENDEIKLRKEVLLLRNEKKKEFVEKSKIVAQKMALKDAEKEFALDEDALLFDKAIKENKQKNKKFLHKIEKQTKAQKRKAEVMLQRRRKNLARINSHKIQSQLLYEELDIFD